MSHFSLLKRAFALALAFTIVVGAFANTPAITSHAQTLPLVELRYTYPSFSPVKDVALVQDALNVLLKQKINATVILEPVDGGAYDQKRKLATAANEPCDVVFTAPWINNYFTNISQGNLLPLDKLLAAHAPKTFASLSPAIWNAARLNGNIYGVINEQPFVRTWGIFAAKDIATKYKLDLTAISKYEDLEPFLAAVKAGEKNVTPLAANVRFRSEYFGYDPVDGSGDDAVLVVKADDAALKVVNIAETDQYAQTAKLAYKWLDAGYAPAEPLSDADQETGLKSRKNAVKLFVVNPDSGADQQSKSGYEFVTKGLHTPILTTAGVIATMNGICATSKNPERAMMFLELLNTDEAVYHLITHGIEGKHYLIKDAAKKVIGLPEKVTADTNGYNPNTPWMFGKLFNSYYSDPAIAGVWDQMRDINNKATPSQALGFVFNPEPVKAEVAQVQAAVKQYGKPIADGLVDPATAIPTYLSKLKEAGIEKVRAELQTQLTAWKAAKKS